MLLRSLWLDDLLHSEGICSDDSKIVEDLGSFSIDSWTLQFHVCVCYAVVCWCIYLVYVLWFCIWNNREFWDSFFLDDLAGCSRNKGIHPVVLVVVYCALLDYHLLSWVHALALHLKWKAG